MPAEQPPIPMLQPIRDELRCRRTHLIRHGTQSLEQHLVGTYDILTAWQQPRPVAYAGLLHSAYSTDVFKHQTFTFKERDRVRELVGERAERLAYLFCIVDRRDLLTATRAAVPGATDGFAVCNRLDGSRVDITRADAGDLVAIYMANAAEQSCRPDRSPATWLSNVSQMGLAARALTEVIPAVFDGCTTVVPKAEETQLLEDYLDLLARFGTDDDAPHTRRGAHDWPVVGEPLVWAGLHAIRRGAPEDASEFGRVAAERLQRWATPWDKRLSLHQWLLVCAALRDGAQADELAFVAQRATAATQSVSPSPERMYAELERARLLPTVGDAGMTGYPHPMISVAERTPRGADGRRPQALPARFETYLAGLKTNHDRPRMTRYPGLRSTPLHDAAQFQLARDLEDIAEAVAAEAHALGSNEFHDESEGLKRSGRWRVLFLYERGRKNDDNCTLCPQTTAVIEANRTVLSLGGLAYFSRLEADSHIAPHTGPTNMRLRCHLGIDVPPDCGLRVGGVTTTWREGRCLVFDDSLTHEAWNRSPRDRLVLVVDLWHPDLTNDEVALLDGLHRYAAANGTNLARYWSRNRAATAAVNDHVPPPGSGSAETSFTAT